MIDRGHGFRFVQLEVSGCIEGKSNEGEKTQTWGRKRSKNVNLELASQKSSKTKHVSCETSEFR